MGPALGTVLGAILAGRAGWWGPWWLAWVSVGLMVLPLAWGWPAVLVSPAGQLVVLLLLLVVVGLAVETVRRPRPV